jgi:hypothetical protein
MWSEPGCYRSVNTECGPILTNVVLGAIKGPCCARGLAPAGVSGLIKVFMPLVRLGPPGGLQGVSDGVFLKVRSAFLVLAGLKRLGSLSAQVNRASVLDRLFGGADPLQVPKEPLHLGPPIVLSRLKRHFHRRLAVAGPVLDLREVGDRFHEHLDGFPAPGSGHVSDLLRGGADRVPVKAGDDRRMGKALGAFTPPLAGRRVAAPVGISKVPEPSGFFRGIAALGIVAA